MAATKGMIHVPSTHPIIENVFRQKLVPDAKQEPCDIKIGDTDNVSYHIQATKGSEHLVKLIMDMPVLKSIGVTAKPLLNKKYGQYLVKESGSTVTLEVDVKKNAGAGSEDLVSLLGNLKRNLLAAPFEEAFDALLAGNSGKLKPTIIPYRAKEYIILQPSGDRVNVFVTIDFDEETDAAIAEVILQEFTEARRSIPNAPNVVWSQNLPVELSKVQGVKKQGTEVGYIMFQVFSTHVSDKAQRDKVITLLLSLRSYLHYHIKASKAHLHTRMRKRVKNLLQMLNRAKPTDQDDKRKKTFRQY